MIGFIEPSGDEGHLITVQFGRSLLGEGACGAKSEGSLIRTTLDVIRVVGHVLYVKIHGLAVLHLGIEGGVSAGVLGVSIDQGNMPCRGGEHTHVHERSYSWGVTQVDEYTVNTCRGIIDCDCAGGGELCSSKRGAYEIALDFVIIFSGPFTGYSGGTRRFG